MKAKLFNIFFWFAVLPLIAAGLASSGYRFLHPTTMDNPPDGQALLRLNTDNTLECVYGSSGADCWPESTGGPGGGGAAVEIDTAGKGYFAPWGLPHTLSGGGAVASGNQSRFFAFTNPYKITFTKLTAWVQAAASTSEQGAQWAVYDSNCDVIVKSTAKDNLNSTGAQEFAFTSTVLDPGIYYMGYTSESTGLQWAGAATGSVVQGLLNRVSGAQANHFSGTAATGSGTSISLPNSCGTRTSINAPAQYVVLLP